MKLDWDPAKARLNFAKHGVSFEEAAQAVEDANAIEFLDDAFGDEERFQLIGLAGAKCLVVIYTERSGQVRIISARKANKHEQKTYLEQSSTKDR